MRRTVSDTQDLLPFYESAPPSADRASRPIASRLLQCLNQLPSSLPLAEALSMMVHVLHEALPQYAFALRIPAHNLMPPVLFALPEDAAWSDDPWDPNLLLFPMFAHERCFPIPVRSHTAYFHCASDDPSLEAAESDFVRSLMECAEMLLAAIRLFDACHAIAQHEEKLKAMHRSLRQSNKLAALGEASTGLMHELSNPLTTIMTYTDYLKQKANQRGDGEDAERLRRVGEAAAFVLTFTRAFLSYARPDDELARSVPVAQAIEQSVLFCKHWIDSANVNVTVDVEATPCVHIGQTQLVQVLVNLVANACQAMAPKGGNLTISATTLPSDGMVRIRVEDTGPGIDPDIVHRLFDLFFTTNNKEQGSGVGLSIVHDIVTKSKGSIAVDSTPGHGTSFIVMLPISPEYSCPPSPTMPPSSY